MFFHVMQECKCSLHLTVMQNAMNSGCRYIGLTTVGLNSVLHRLHFSLFIRIIIEPKEVRIQTKCYFPHNSLIFVFRATCLDSTNHHGALLYKYSK